jgi:hypothetical protein
MNSWIQHQKKYKGQGLTSKQISELYHAEGGGIIGDAYKKVTNLIGFKNRFGEMPKGFYNFLKLHGHEKIIGLQVIRMPVQSYVEKIINWVSLGRYEKNKKELQYDEVFHLFLVLRTNPNNKASTEYRVEKNHVVEAKQFTEVERGKEVRNPSWEQTYENELYIRLPQGWKCTVEEFFSKGANLQGKGYFKYSAYNNNCQCFCAYNLKANGLNNDQTKKFILQDGTKILKKIPGLEAITDIAGIGQSIIDKLPIF